MTLDKTRASLDADTDTGTDLGQSHRDFCAAFEDAVATCPTPEAVAAAHARQTHFASVVELDGGWLVFDNGRVFHRLQVIFNARGQVDWTPDPDWADKHWRLMAHVVFTGDLPGARTTMGRWGQRQRSGYREHRAGRRNWDVGKAVLLQRIPVWAWAPR